ncbi:MAG TPA: alpha/beta fold hydrolase [Candidatus Saccharimonadia bacterium]
MPVTIGTMHIPQCQPVSFLSTDQLQLKGLLFGNAEAVSAYIVIHGLTGSAFSQHETVVPLANERTQVLTFSNRGHDKIAYFKRTDPNSEKGYVSEKIGEAHEVFTECIHDIQGAITFLEERGVQAIHLVGHSTGCHKAMYYLSQKPSKSVKGAVLLCPLSDYAYFRYSLDEAIMSNAITIAQKMVGAGKPHELLPLDIWPGLEDAQRFLSLATPDSEEEIFTYAQPDKEPETLQKVTVSLNIILAEQDEARDRPITEIGEWFKTVLPEEQIKVSIIPGATHNLIGKGEEVREGIKLYIP